MVGLHKTLLAVLVALLMLAGVMSYQLYQLHEAFVVLPPRKEPKMTLTQDVTTPSGDVVTVTTPRQAGDTDAIHYARHKSMVDYIKANG